MSTPETRRWYKSAAWQRRRAYQLAIEPCCRMCAAEGKVTSAEVADHIEPHGGDYTKFVMNPLQSLCRSCHSGRKQEQERHGFYSNVGLDGWPLDPRHPANCGRDDAGSPTTSASASAPPPARWEPVA